MKRQKHTIYYKNIPIADYYTIDDIKMRDPNEIFIDNIDRFDSAEDVAEFVKAIFSNLFYFLKGNIPEGIRYQSLAEQSNNINVLEIAPKLDEFTGDISIDKCDTRKFLHVSDAIVSGADLTNLIPQEEFTFTSSDRAYGERPSSFAGYFDKFTAVLEEDVSGPILRESRWEEEVGNVIVKAQADRFPSICVNEAFCNGLAERCGLEVPRRWLVSIDDGWGLKRHYVAERFGIGCDANGHVVRDLIFDTGILLGDRIRDNYSISSEEYFDFMRTLLDESDMYKFMDAYLFGFVIGNSDMHVKNFSVKYSKGRFELAPIYDMVSFKPYGLRDDIALSINGKNYITSKQFFDFITDQGMSPAHCADMCRAVLDNFEETAPKYIDQNRAEEKSLYERIGQYIKTRCFELIELGKPKRSLKPEYDQEQS